MDFYDKLAAQVKDVKVEITDTSLIIHGYLFTNQTFHKEIANKSRAPFLFKKRTYLYLETYKFFIPEIKLLLSHLLSIKNKYGIHVPNCTRALELIEELETKAEEETKAKIDLKLIEREMVFSIAKHQKPVFDKYLFFKNRLDLRGLLLDAEPGTGKTFMSLALTTGLKADKVIIICPLPTVDNVWKKSLSSPEKVFNKQQEYYYIRDKDYKGQKYIISHYEALEELKLFLENNRYFNKEKIAIIIDECHNFNERNSKRSMLLLDLVNKSNPADVFLLSGTPVKGEFKELIVIFSLLNKDFVGTLQKKFEGFYRSCGYPVSEWLTQRYKSNSIKVKKESLGLEPVITSYVKIKLPGKLANEFLLTTIRDKLILYIKNRMKQFKEKEKWYAEQFSKVTTTGINILKERKQITDKEIKEYYDTLKFIKANPQQVTFYPTKLKYLNSIEDRIIKTMETKEERHFYKELKVIYKYPHLKAQGEGLGRVVTGARINCHKEMAKVIRYEPIINSTNKKTLIFSNYVEVCESAFNTLVRNKFKPLRVYGEYVKDLALNVEKFKLNKKDNPLVATYQSLGTGVPLIAANVVICMDLPFRQYLYDQAISRVWRLGQDQQVYVYILNLDTGEEPNINTRNIDIIQYFKEEVERLLGYKSALDITETEVLTAECFDFYSNFKKRDLFIDKSKYEMGSNTFKVFRRMFN